MGRLSLFFILVAMLLLLIGSLGSTAFAAWVSVTTSSSATAEASSDGENESVTWPQPETVLEEEFIIQEEAVQTPSTDQPVLALNRSMPRQPVPSATESLPLPATVVTSQTDDQASATPAPDPGASEQLSDRIVSQPESVPVAEVVAAEQLASEDQTAPQRLTTLMLSIIYILVVDTILLIVILLTCVRALRAVPVQRF